MNVLFSTCTNNNLHNFEERGVSLVFVLKDRTAALPCLQVGKSSVGKETYTNIRITFLNEVFMKETFIKICLSVSFPTENIPPFKVKVSLLCYHSTATNKFFLSIQYFYLLLNLVSSILFIYYLSLINYLYLCK